MNDESKTKEVEQAQNPQSDKVKTAGEVKQPPTASTSAQKPTNPAPISSKQKKNKKGGTPEALLRARFLLGAAELAATKTKDASAGAALSAHLGSHLVKITKKAVLRVKPEVKRSLCKGCRVTLAAGKTAKVTLEGRGKGKKTVWHCRQCGTTKSMLVRDKKPFKRVKKNKKN